MHVVRATLAVRVPVNATGSLADGAARIVERIDTVERVEKPDVRGLQPGLNDTTVDLCVRVTFATDWSDDGTTARQNLADGFGVQTVDRIETVEPDAPPPRIG